MTDSNQQMTSDEHPFVFHMVEAKHWSRTLTTGDIYYPKIRKINHIF